MGIYRLTFHPLAKYPGPLLSKLSGWPTFWEARSGNRHMETWKQHEIYGEFAFNPYTTPEIGVPCFLFLTCQLHRSHRPDRTKRSLHKHNLRAKSHLWVTQVQCSEIQLVCNRSCCSRRFQPPHLSRPTATCVPSARP